MCSVCSVVTIKRKFIISGGERRLFSFLVLECDSCLLNCIDFTTQIQINKHDSMNHIRISKEILLLD